MQWDFCFSFWGSLNSVAVLQTAMGEKSKYRSDGVYSPGTEWLDKGKAVLSGTRPHLEGVMIIPVQTNVIVTLPGQNRGPMRFQPHTNIIIEKAGSSLPEIFSSERRDP